MQMPFLMREERCLEFIEISFIKAVEIAVDTWDVVKN